MANTATVTKLMEGDRNAVFHVFLASDGSSGELEKFVLIDPAADLDPILQVSPILTIDKIWYDLIGFNARLDFDYLIEETGILALSGGNANYADFSLFGGLKDRSSSFDGTGKLLLTTNGLLSEGDCGSIVIKVRKN